MENCELFIIAGDPSGDAHGARLVRELKTLVPGVSIVGAGGRELENAGMRNIFNLVDYPVIGVVEVFSHIAVFWNLLKKIRKYFLENRPGVVVLIDYPGFNLIVARMAHKLNIPVVYYIPPQIWAWGRSRARTLAKLVTKMIVILPFEKEFYQRMGIEAEFVGHPILDRMSELQTRKEETDDFGLDTAYPVVGILPGSRIQEVSKLLPIMLKTADIIARQEKVQFVLPLSAHITAEDVDPYLEDFKFPVRVIRDPAFALRRRMTLALVASGTATLENACLGLPMIIIYRVSWLSYFIARLLVRVKRIGLVNIVAGRGLVPEFIQQRAKPKDIARIALEWLNDGSIIENMRKELLSTSKLLGKQGASVRAAGLISQMISH